MHIPENLYGNGMAPLTLANPAGPWAPLAPGAVAELLRDATFPWWLAGGWAIDLFVGRQTRPHHDTDVQVLRRDQLAVQAHLRGRGWDLHAADPPGALRPWTPAEALPAPVHDVWGRPAPGAPWGLQLMLADTYPAAQRWVFRRDPRVSVSLTRLGRRTPEGLPYIAPEVQLLFKAKPTLLAKDEADFAAALPRLSDESRSWLATALAETHPSHPWLRTLAG